MHRTYTARLKTTKRQDGKLSAMLVECCELYNAALQERRDAWKTCRKNISLYDQFKGLTELRKAIPESASFPAHIQRDPLCRVDRAFKAFFLRAKAGKVVGYPRFKPISRYDSFAVGSQNFNINTDIIKIVKLGSFRFKTKCKMKGVPKELRVKRVGNRWIATIVCDIGPGPEKIAIRNATGIDLGLTSLATLSDGTEIANPRWTKREEDRLAEANRTLSRKIKGSRNRLKARERLRRIHQRIAGLRSSYLTSVAKQLVNEYDLIAHEKLNIKGMAQSRFAKSIMDAAWNQLIHRLNCEAEKAGKWVVPVDPKGTTQRCSGCRVMVKKELKDRWHSCPCGTSLDRDHNAAINILRLGESLVLKQNCMVLSC
jgi:putative transposase